MHLFDFESSIRDKVQRLKHEWDKDEAIHDGDPNVDPEAPGNTEGPAYGSLDAPFIVTAQQNNYINEHRLNNLMNQDRYWLWFSRGEGPRATRSRNPNAIVNDWVEFAKWFIRRNRHYIRSDYSMRNMPKFKRFKKLIHSIWVILAEKRPGAYAVIRDDPQYKVRFDTTLLQWYLENYVHGYRPGDVQQLTLEFPPSEKTTEPNEEALEPEEEDLQEDAVEPEEEEVAPEPVVPQNVGFDPNHFWGDMNWWSAYFQQEQDPDRLWQALVSYYTHMFSDSIAAYRAEHPDAPEDLPLMDVVEWMAGQEGMQQQPPPMTPAMEAVIQAHGGPREFGNAVLQEAVVRLHNG